MALVKDARAGFDLLGWPFLLGLAVAGAPITNQLYVPIIAMLALGLAVLRDLGHGVVRKPVGPDAWVMAYSGYAVLSYLWSPAQASLAGRTLVMEYVGLAALFLLIRRYATAPRRWRFIGACYLVGVAVDLVLVLASWLTDTSYEGNGRYSIAGVNSNYTAYAMATAIPIVFAIYWSEPRRKARHALTAGVFVALLGLAIAVTGCRGATLAYLLGVVVAVMAFVRVSPIRGVVVTGTIAAVTLRYWSALADLVPSRLLMQDAAGEDFSSGRFTLWQRALDVFSEHPMFGAGADAFPLMAEEGMHAHNVFLSVLAELGSVGMLIFLAVLGAVFIRFIRAGAAPWIRAAAAIAFVVWLAIASTGVWQSAPPAWILFGWIAAAPAIAFEQVVAEGSTTWRNLRPART
jgi:O-antigen ligase